LRCVSGLRANASPFRRSFLPPELPTRAHDRTTAVRG
jgi:hypothetical protein